ncbi:LysR substrate-binding domain-containing protein [Roseibium suaedae]|uniref:DNA-binding transcriptional regulator, LysR family n=1 Tax=Roseibium suaedae TaxID=735517 RepID=A0A1M7CHS9_9HYPH|nr:LysR substrate-binding domain-containing protein [Roseibium suaedae]SHL66755.1 DNA-binding transcriptional regulator, LysR family [Roseibium suaedae]
MHQTNNLRAIDLNLLVVLDALIAEQHLSRAAERLNMSQPAVSHALARLRRLLDDPLFTREGGRLMPTLRTLELTLPLSEALSQIRTVLTPAAFDPASRHLFRIAASDFGTSLLLPGMMQRLRQKAPGIDLVVTQASREAMVAAVTDGDIDLALGVFPSLPAQVEAETLFEDSYACLLDPACQPQPFDGLTEALYFDAPHILVAVHGEAATEIDMHLRASRKTRRIALVLPHWSVAPSLVEGTDLILTAARRSLKPAGGRLLTVLPPLPLPVISFSAILHRRRRADPALRWLLSEIREIAAG